MMVRKVRVVLEVETDGHLRDLHEKGLWDWAGDQRFFRVTHATAEVQVRHRAPLEPQPQPTLCTA